MNQDNREGRRLGPRVAFLFAALAFLSFSPSLSGADRPMAATPAAGPGTAQRPRPRLVVVIVVDQLRGDLLPRYSGLFSGGFKRVMEQGLYFSNALHPHATTETAPGHATISTGVYPARAGIPSNVWREGSGRNLHPVFNVVNPDYSLVGVEGLPGASPDVLARGGLADWVLAANPEAKVVSVSAKDRGAILMAGKTHGEVYWFSSQAGLFVTSNFYKTENPSWLDAFNRDVLPGFRADSVWSSTIPEGAQDLSSPDTASFEGDGVHTFFPHRYYEERIDPGTDDFFLWFEGTPMLDEATMRLAKVAVEESGAGTLEGRTDFLSVSFSQTDRIGHPFGPLSREQMDNLLRLDRVLGDFLTFLDERVGAGNYVLGLTSDHGVMTAPERLGQGGVRLTRADRSFLEQALNQAAQEANQDSDLSLAAAMVGHLKEIPWVGPAYTHDALRSGAALDSIGVMYRHSFVPGRPGGLLSTYGVEMWWADNTLDWSIETGTTHGGPYIHDRWVPLILMGPEINAGLMDEVVRPLDLAPTLAWLAGIPFPDDLDGKPLPVGGS